MGTCSALIFVTDVIRFRSSTRGRPVVFVALDFDFCGFLIFCHKREESTSARTTAGEKSPFESCLFFALDSYSLYR